MIATSGALGILFPPSINLVIYAVATSGMQPEGPTGTSSTPPRSASCSSPGVVPGLMLAAHARRSPPGIAPGAMTIRACSGPAGANASRAFRESFWGLFLIVLVLGGIYSGLFTPTEAAAVAAVYAFFIAVFVYKELKLTDVPAVLLTPPR